MQGIVAILVIALGIVAGHWLLMLLQQKGVLPSG